MTVASVEIGSTHHSWQFGKEVEAKLLFMAEHPEQIEPIPGSIVYGNLKYIIHESKHSPKDFKLIMFKTRRNAKKHNHCWIIVSDFWAGIMERLCFEFGRNGASRFFLHQFCKFDEAMMAEYERNFHLHFLAKSKLGDSMTFWKNYLISEHRGSIEYIKKTNCFLQVVDKGEYPHIGFIDITPLEILRDCKYAIRPPVAAVG